MNKLVYIIAALLTLTLFSACGSDDNNEVAVLTSITINPIDKDLYIGDTYQLTVSHQPTDVKLPKLTWTSSDTKVATVSNSGLVEVKADGVVTITATYGDLSNSLIIVALKKQNYTSIVIINAYELAIVNCVIGYRTEDLTIKKIATLGDIQAGKVSDEIIVDYNNIKKVMVFFDTWEGQSQQEDMAYIHRNGSEDYFNIYENKGNIISLSKPVEKAYKPSPNYYPQ